MCIVLASLINYVKESCLSSDSQVLVAVSSFLLYLLSS